MLKISFIKRKKIKAVPIVSDPKRVNLQWINVVFIKCFKGFGKRLCGEWSRNGESGPVG